MDVLTLNAQDRHLRSMHRMPALNSNAQDVCIQDQCTGYLHSMHRIPGYVCTQCTRCHGHEINGMYGYAIKLSLNSRDSSHRVQPDMVVHTTNPTAVQVIIISYTRYLADMKVAIKYMESVT
jgi:6-pyruvoyl-tetrahydropterin synthase